MGAAAVVELVTVSTACLGLGTSIFNDGGDGSRIFLVMVAVGATELVSQLTPVVLDSNDGTRPLTLTTVVEMKQQS